MEEQQILLARLDERTKAMADNMQRIENRIDHHFVSTDEHNALKTEVDTLKRIVYGSVLAVVVSLAGSIMTYITHGVK